jgi:hypothetical protein
MAKIGEVYRVLGGNAFADAVVYHVDEEGNADLARPYAYAKAIGNSLLGCERITHVSPDTLSHWKLITEGRQVI